MSDFTSNLVPLSAESDDRSLPERIAAQYKFPLAHKDHDDGRRYYSVRDWIEGVAKPDSHPGTFWTQLKKRARKAGFELDTRCLKFDYTASNGKQYKMDYADDETLYQITQRMDASTGRRNEVLAYLAKAGVILDEMYRDPDKADKIAALMRENKEYRKLRAEGFTHEEAVQWLDARDHSIGTRKWITAIWMKRKANGKDFGKLTDRVSEIVHGKTVRQRKREMGLTKYKTPRKYDSAADQALTALTELMSGMLHEQRESLGVDELLEDVDDTRPIVNSARPSVNTAFSKKPRRLPSENKPQLPE